VTASLHVDAVTLLRDWTPPTADQGALRDDYLAHMSLHEDGHLRAQRTGYLTASTLVVDADNRRVLLTLHPLVGRWLQLGGHIEADDASVTAAAYREAMEESGIARVEVDPVPVQLDRHLVTCRDGEGGSITLAHLDIQFVALAAAGSTARRSDESLDLRWWPWDALPEQSDNSVRSLVEGARRRLGR
jgi:8-oxo-dGTP pyrophosphatase MutT (NUDIX family)